MQTHQRLYQQHQLLINDEAVEGDDLFLLIIVQMEITHQVIMMEFVGLSQPLLEQE